MCPCVRFPKFLAQFCHNCLKIVGGAVFSKSAGMISTSGVLLFGSWLIAHTISSWRIAGSISASLSSSSLLLAYSSSIYNCHLSWYLIGQTVFSLACFDDTFMNSVLTLLHYWCESSCSPLLVSYNAGPSKLLIFLAALCKSAFNLLASLLLWRLFFAWLFWWFHLKLTCFELSDHV